MCVPYTGSEAWTNSLGFAVTDDWRPWLTADNQVAGYTKGWLSGQFTFATVKGSGHTVPAYKPKQALTFFQRWLAGSPL
jgi:serine carboxypeptidase-like clade 1